MGTLSIVQTDRLFWLGRYLERVKTTLDVSGEIQEFLLDGVEGYDLGSICRRLSIPNIYEDTEDFVERFLFDEDNPDSVVSNMNRAFDNAIVMRDVLRSNTLSYVQLALNTLLAGKKSPSPKLEMQETLDYLYAFWGAVEDNVTDTKTRYIMRCGRSVERVDMMLRLRMHDDELKGEATRLTNRLYRSGMRYDGERFQTIVERFENDDWQQFVPQLIDDVENLVQTW